MSLRERLSVWLRRSGVTLLCVAVSAGTLGATPTAGADEFRTRWTGSWHCNDRGSTLPLAGARVELWQRGLDVLPTFLTDELIAVQHANDGGAYEFNTVSSKEDDFYIRVLTDDNARVRLGNWWEPWPWFTDTGTNQNDVAEQSFGDLAIKLRRFADSGSPECAVWQGIRDAYLAFEAEMGFAPPAGRRRVQAKAPLLTPVAPYTEILWPPFAPAGAVELVEGVEVPSKRTAVHEFAHTFRHAYDGDAVHFFLDAAAFIYPRTHKDCDKTNLGFAFNEGWAEYWAGQFPRDETGNVAPCGGEANRSNHRYEGNVALSLLALEQCPEYTRQDLVDTLANSPGQIHSFDEFEGRLRTLHGGCVDVPEPFDDPRLSLDGSYERRRFLRAVRTDLRSLRKTEARLRDLRDEALDDRRELFPCWRRGSCMNLLVEQILPPVLGGELAVTRLVRKRLSFQLDRKAVRRLGKPMTARFQRRLRGKTQAIRRGAARVEAEWLGKALKAARPILKRDDTAAVQELGRRLRSSLKAFEKGRLPQGYAWSAATKPLVQAASPAPDLVIERLYINSDAGWRIYADVRNIGDASAAATKTMITQEGQPEVQVDTPELAAGAMATVSIECFYTGVAKAIARADATGLVAESSEANNEASVEEGGTSGQCRYP